MVPATALAVLLAGCAGYVPGQKGYWDAQLRDMCAKDGGVRIFEKLRISRADISLLGQANGNIGIPIKEVAHPTSPAYAEISRTYLREANPEVSRIEIAIIRRADRALLARSVVYSRFGGDLPGPWHPSSFRCPDREKTSNDLQQLFLIEDKSK